ncbi:phage holin family protein [Streptomyces sp. UNOC14_S4]|uniref:phage holin family protein n=1 Tax=Streptomyces sp. UNOC14_S4 TaxID=2872340 RepID=UPI001E4D4834|nr:phage holin family protein [Streptomyces sp. UNOC14_S4]MCC3769283.1 phage holin family protein [Streptomyces sp. UNOC14_S4]
MSAADDGAATGVNGADGVNRSLGQLVATATTELSALVHDEIALAKAELREDARRVGIGGGAIAAAGVLALFSLPVLSFAAAYGVHNLGLGLAWSFLIVGGAFLLIAALLGLLAVRKFKKVSKPERTIASAKETAAVLGTVKPHPEPLVGTGRSDASVTRSTV